MIDIFGFGECGSNITFDVFEQLYPDRILPTSEGDTTIGQKVAQLAGSFLSALAGTNGTGPPIGLQINFGSKRPQIPIV